ncbi:leucyl aminopeptidase family protein [Sphingobium nicotianae]|uniref:Leucyl aminopeptidase family protein n=1 Tax=Sphingobium nicotianae TaxID=2782607 RepID=A0A9X1DBB6_9SPHN|nr:leucyl aminopeptidase family protein [Sphingobium nicotianae]MBT2186895.1 leucyl aminopeptidase family protein [Sphingobium nicotianae]
MTDPADLVRPDTGQAAHLIHLVDARSHDDWLNAQPDRHRAALLAQGFKASAFAHAILPGEQPEDWAVVAAVADTDALSSWCLAKLADVLPEGSYKLASGEPGPAILGWMTAQYRFDRYKEKKAGKGARVLLTAQPGAIDGAAAQARATALVRDMVNVPTADMGPDQIEAQAQVVANRHGAAMSVIRGDALEAGFPMIHAVGRAADRSCQPRLIELIWGREDAPRIAVVGKGVTFDTGGLDIKPSSAMRLMKKDMGGAAHALALADLIMNANLPVRLHLLLPIAENAISGNAFRPGDVLRSRKGLTVEIGNTDAEGRLILGDALTRAGEDEPELIIDFATLTGAARVALGPDLPALFANDDALAAELAACGTRVDDPMWRLPLWEPYNDLFKSDIADLNNAGESGYAGATTAALFLQRFIPDKTLWAHFDTFAWRPTAKPGRPKGGDALGLRATFAMLQGRYGR